MAIPESEGDRTSTVRYFSGNAVYQPPVREAEEPPTRISVTPFCGNVPRGPASRQTLEIHEYPK